MHQKNLEVFCEVVSLGKWGLKSEMLEKGDSEQWGGGSKGGRGQME